MKEIELVKNSRGVYEQKGAAKVKAPKTPARKATIDRVKQSPNQIVESFFEDLLSDLFKTLRRDLFR